MTVNVKLFAGLRQYAQTKDGKSVIELPDGSTVSDALACCGIPQDKPRILLLNGRHAGLDQLLQPGDTLSLFPPVAGG
jgi:molybdopterin synthase sulfur carrier subunit